MLTNYKKRSFVIELERIQVVRRCCKASLIYCAECKAETDFISLKQAESLFEIDSAQILKFINVNFSHYKTDKYEEIFICLPSFIACINVRTNNPAIKLLV